MKSNVICASIIMMIYHEKSAFHCKESNAQSEFPNEIANYFYSIKGELFQFHAQKNHMRIEKNGR